MKKKNIILSTFSAVILLSSCIRDFEEVNTNPLGATDEHIKTEGLAAGGLFPGLVDKPIPLGVNAYQVSQNISADNWVGYFAPGGSAWDGGKNTTHYFISDFRGSQPFPILLTNIMNTYFAIKEATHDLKIEDGNLIYNEKGIQDRAFYAMAQIVKVMGVHRATDMYGPIPYTDMRPDKITAKYDSQETVYKTFLSELEKAVATLNEYGYDKKLMTEYDPIYQGDVSKWIKLGNSLMLRLAMRVRYADDALAREYITKPTSHPVGLITEADKVAKLQTNGKYVYNNPLAGMLGYKELKMGVGIYSYLKGYNDPRIEVYFDKTTIGGTQSEDYYAVRSGVANVAGSDYEQYSLPKIDRTTPVYWFKASETYFLLAEAALFNYVTTNTAAYYYQKGIELSFEENSVKTTVATYLASSGTPAAYTDPKNSNFNASAVSTIDKQWSDSASTEENLERIITQKYLAIYPDGLEAWSEWRRTGYPRMFKIPSNQTNVNAADISDSGKDNGVRRYPFAYDEYQLNTENVNAAKALLGGADNAATNVWWDKKSKN